MSRCSLWLAGKLRRQRFTSRTFSLKIHVGGDGKVLTTLPKKPEGPEGPEGSGNTSIPEINLRGGQVTIDQDGRPAFALHGVDLSVLPEGDQVKITGAVDDPVWSKWSLHGNMNQSTQTGSVAIGTEKLPLTMDRLTSIPFVPEEVWKNVQLNGDAGVGLNLAIGPHHEVHYELIATPRLSASPCRKPG